MKKVPVPAKASTLKEKTFVFSSEAEAEAFVGRHPGTSWSYDPVVTVWKVVVLEPTK